MTIFQTIAVLVTLTALLSYVNFRWLKLPTTIGVMLIALLLSLGLIALTHLGVDLQQPAEHLLSNLHFDETLLQGMLSFLLFAGALQINLDDLLRQKWIVASLSVAGVVLSSAIFATLTYFLFLAFGIELSYIWCLLFGALISPTDPVAVLALLKNAKVPKDLEVLISGESLFNDGVGVVLFTFLYEIVQGEQDISVKAVVWLLLQEGVGGVLLGLVLGWIAYRLLKSIDQYQVEVLLTLALVCGGYALATAVHASGPIAIVTAGLLIGNHGRKFAMSDTTREHLDTFWELVDEILNALLFVLIGLEVLVLKFTGAMVVAALATIPLLLAARWVSVAVPTVAVRWRRPVPRGTIRILTWSALRGGISVAMALSLPMSRERDLIVSITYVLVVFAIGVQGLTIGPFARRVFRPPPLAPAGNPAPSPEANP